MLGHKNVVFNEYFPLSKLLFECAVSKNRGVAMLYEILFCGALILVELLKGVRLHASPSYSIPFLMRRREGKGVKVENPFQANTLKFPTHVKSKNWILVWILFTFSILYIFKNGTLKQIWNPL